ncbi:hypothetical protein AYY18_08790 [Morganella psychrotolerans]|uniref:Uncharacterized protein n=1 Tax=Morganella psychrotolerans TaxID=368603 RepID=A0A1B8H7X4_9GAMM|nr:hypothetical protein AYY18_08790 [Morganella psychrotolerans]
MEQGEYLADWLYQTIYDLKLSVFIDVSLWVSQSIVHSVSLQICQMDIMVDMRDFRHTQLQSQIIIRIPLAAL